VVDLLLANAVLLKCGVRPVYDRSWSKSLCGLQLAAKDVQATIRVGLDHEVRVSLMQAKCGAANANGLKIGMYVHACAPVGAQRDHLHFASQSQLAALH